jgi:hypothetical protein
MVHILLENGADVNLKWVSLHSIHKFCFCCLLLFR